MTTRVDRQELEELKRQNSLGLTEPFRCKSD